MRARQQANLPFVRMILPGLTTWRKVFSHEEVQFKKFCTPVKINITFLLKKFEVQIFFIAQALFPLSVNFS